VPTLQDRIVWITGAGSGIGRAIAIVFAAAGARVAFRGRRIDALDETASEIGQAAIVVPADVTNADQVTDAHETINNAWGAVDVLVNSAGRNSSKRHLGQLTVPEMSSILDANLKTAFLCSMAVLPAKLQHCRPNSLSSSRAWRTLLPALECGVHFREIETLLRLDILRCLSPQMLHKELLLHLIAYNLIRCLMQHAAISHQVDLSRLS
jgi:NAD(P)-dependent dehydrogenase (short-subunit alcohol dehydrogenase family)